MSVTFAEPALPRSDLDILTFMLNTGFHVSSTCREEAYFVYAGRGTNENPDGATRYFRTARAAMESMMAYYEAGPRGQRWREGWKSTAELDA